MFRSQGGLNRAIFKAQPATENTNGTRVVGVLRTAGLSAEDFASLKIAGTNFQVTDFRNHEPDAPVTKPAGYFLYGQNIDQSLIGRCVSVAGVVPDWWSIDVADVYDRSALEVGDISPVIASKCSPYRDSLIETVETEQKFGIGGTIRRASRPAPDIGYDYEIVPAEPFYDELNAAGSTSPARFVTLVPATNEQWQALEALIGNEASVWGAMVWGYAESRYLQVRSVTGL